MDLITQILKNPSFDWDFVFTNAITKRPCGDVIFIAVQSLLKQTTSKVSIIHSKRGYCIVVQLHLTRGDGQEMTDPEPLIKYLESTDTISQIRDIDNPFYNIEWHFYTNKAFCYSFLNKLKHINVPLAPSGIMYKLNGYRSLIIDRELYVLNLLWACEDPRYHEVIPLLDEILNHSLKQVNKAFWSGA